MTYSKYQKLSAFNPGDTRCRTRCVAGPIDEAVFKIILLKGIEKIIGTEM
jgi:hypothetical protein